MPINIPVNAAPTRPGPIPGVDRIIAVLSGKGGVGKSTVAINTALALEQLGLRVGLLDADIYGPSQPTMLGISHKPKITAKGRFEPIVRFHLKTMSIGYLVDVDTPMIWRGPMVSKALQQLLFDTDWGTLDYLVMDLPPGTGDIQLTMAQKVPVHQAVIVTTPQDIALIDARKAVEMCLKVGVPVSGLIENMSVYVCPECGCQAHIFGHAGGESMSKQLGIPLLGRIPLDGQLCTQMDQAMPPVWSDPKGSIAAQYQAIARKLHA